VKGKGELKVSRKGAKPQRKETPYQAGRKPVK
jgi:hypothetical protein